MSDSVDPTSDRMRRFTRSVLLTYAELFFCDRVWFGVVVLAGTFAVPAYGALGLTGVVFSIALDRLTGIRAVGRCNVLLTSLAVAHLQACCLLTVTQTLGLLAVAVMLTHVLSVTISAWISSRHRLPALSLAFVAVHFLLYFATLPLPKVWPDVWSVVPAWQPTVDAVHFYFEAFSAITFVSDPAVGALIAFAVGLWSPLLLSAGSVGLLGGWLALQGLPEPLMTPVRSAGWLSFNFLFVGMILGAAERRPGWSSLGWALLGGAACVPVGLAEVHLFTSGVPPTAIVLHLVALPILAASRISGAAPGVQGLQRPEERFARESRTAVRFPHTDLISIRCPFVGERVVTQGVDGGITHRGRWGYALDFESHADSGRVAPNLGSPLAEYHTFGLPVFAPEAGVIVAVVDSLPDCAIGLPDYVNNWGNTVVLRLETGLCVALSHLKQFGVLVGVGQRVAAGELLGYVGNSGRSPVPHLHLQMQRVATIGAETHPFCLRHYQASTEAGTFYHTTGVPSAGDRVSPADLRSEMSAAFAPPLTARREYVIDGRNTPRRLAFEWSVTDDGQWQFRDAGGSWLIARIIDSAFYVLDWSLRRDSLLTVVLLAVSRVPFLSRSDVRIVDDLDRATFDPLIPKVWHRVTAPFRSRSPVRVTRSVEREIDGAVAVTTEWDFPLSLLGMSRGVTSVRAVFEPGRFLTELNLSGPAGEQTVRLQRAVTDDVSAAQSVAVAARQTHTHAYPAAERVS